MLLTGETQLASFFLNATSRHMSNAKMGFAMNMLQVSIQPLREAQCLIEQTKGKGPPSHLKLVQLDPVRSAEPPMNSGMLSAIALTTA